ncbi:AbrB/MazE/SpoVT family DNA-binding domain-containing protein [Lacticaseibacillus rhamnosus]|uniref:AbrB/MazE/SpoVT family DNA-binding domain-containing protein n=1 Tax=Lacticaseibacillus rhamnosus TaxID=47715 RepID=UPI001CDB4576
MKQRLVIPIKMRRQLNLDETRELFVKVVDDAIVLRVLPTSDEWADLFKNTPCIDVTRTE